MFRKPTFEFDAGGNPSWFKICEVTGQFFRVEVSHEHYMDWQNGQLIQSAMPELSAEEREFIISGCTPAEFEQVCEETEDGS